MNAAQIDGIFKAAIMRGTSEKPQAKRLTPAKRRAEIAAAQVGALERVLAVIRGKARTMPTWQAAYFSAATAVELEIAAVRASTLHAVGKEG